ncbi:permease [Salinicoccus bachuensis]|uniref:Permease n=1 Tax=Salinicoccus bachuensis TaxID=3136731 RepID=A0ABZ3CLD4_9STAP
MTDSITEFLRTFFLLFTTLIALFIIVSFFVSLLQQIVSEEKIRKVLNHPNKIAGYMLGTLFGAATPFCSCSTIPILAGLLNSKASFGPSMSFLIASPLMNPVMMFTLWALLGWEVALVYFVVLGIFSIFAGAIFSRLDLAKTYKEVGMKVRKEQVPMEEDSKVKQAMEDAWGFLFPMLPYLFIGVFIGAFIYGFVPEAFITGYAGGDGLLSVSIASVVGIPMYIRAETMLPIADALVSKGMSLGTVIALIIGGAGASIPEVVLLSKLFRKRFLVAFISVILFAAVSTGIIFNILL